jgi:signal transduction histidine kinase
VPSTTIALDHVAPAPDEVQAILDAERLRIARELHDVVAYSFATISVQAGVGAHVADARPEKAAEALRIIKAISGDASRELRAILGVLRRVDAADADAPGHGLAEIESLAATTTAAGLTTHVTVSGRAHPLPTALDRAAYRIVQEALTNALRHAGPAAGASVSLVYEPDRVLLEIVDDGPVSTANSDQPMPGFGHGIAGMRERALAVGGEFEAGPQPAGGFRVRATLPLEEEK